MVSFKLDIFYKLSRDVDRLTWEQIFVSRPVKVQGPQPEYAES